MPVNTTTRRPLACAVICLLVLASGCGSDEDSTPGSPEDARPEFASPESPSQDDISDESQDSLQAAIFSQPVVLLGNRFGWCSDVEDVWATLEATLATLLTVEANYEAAIADYETTTDELDRAEARQALEDLGRSYNELLDEAQEALDEAVWQLHDARRARGGQPEGIAYRRAWEALLAADPEVAGLSAAVDPRSSAPTTTAAPFDPNAIGQDDIIRILGLVVEYLADSDSSGDSERASEEAAYAVYSQADSAAVAESLHAASFGAVEAVSEVRVVGPARLNHMARAALDVLLPAGGAALMPYDAEAYDAAFSPGTGNVHNGSYYVDFVRNPDQPIPADDDAFWFAYAARTRAIEAALPATIELVQAIVAQQEAEDQAAAKRQREEAEREKAAEEALQAALETLATGSDAYTMFKRSFEASCQ